MKKNGLISLYELKIQDDTGPLEEKVDVINGALKQLNGGLSSVDSHLVSIAKVLKLV